MIKIENTITPSHEQWRAIIMGTRNPKNSWDRSDTSVGCHEKFCKDCGFNPNWCGNTPENIIGPNDHKLMMSLAKGGPVHAKYRRMVIVYADITAPLYWFKEFDTYRIGTVANSCSTMHKIHAKPFVQDDFSHEHLFTDDESLEFMRTESDDDSWSAIDILNATIVTLNEYRAKFLETNDKKYWWQMIQLLPSSYNQKRTVMLNYEVLHNIYHSRKNHKLDEWHVVCDWIKSLPYSELIVGEDE